MDGDIKQQEDQFIPTRRRFGDIASTRKLIYHNAQQSASQIEPVSNAKHTLQLSNIHYDGPEDIPLSKQKEAILSGKSLTRRLRGTWSLIDNESKKPVDEQHITLAHVPHLTQRGTFVFNGTEYILSHQLRLRPGVYARQKANGELESFVNVASGLGHRYFLEPDTGIFKVQIGQAKLPLLPLLRAMGATDQELTGAWGKDLLAVNQPHDSPHVLKKLHERFVKAQNRTDNPEKDLTTTLNSMTLDPEVTLRTLGRAYPNLSKEAIISSTKKLLAVHKGTADSDDRDHLAYQQLLGPEDLLAERIGKNKLALRQALWQATFRGNLSHIKPGMFDKAIMAGFLGSGLAGTPEGVSASEFIDHGSRVTKMGEGGIGADANSVPDESRSVHPSQLGFVDLVKTPEGGGVGVDLRVAFGVQKGADGRIYAPFRDVKSQRMVYRSPQQVSDSVLAFPGELQSNKKIVTALVDGKTTYVPREDVDIELPSMEQAFSPLSNMVPMKSAVKGQRISMGARMLAQALPLTTREAPYVQSAVPGIPNKSFEELFGRHMGAISADQAGKVLKVDEDGITVKNADGTTKTHELYKHWPGRKTGLHNTVLVHPGDIFKPGQILAKSNFTDDNGTAALGVNARIAYVPYMGKSYEDAAVISEGFAKKLTSEHYYQHRIDWTDQHRFGKRAYTSLFPGTYDKKALEKLDDSGIIKPGTVVNPGDPLILAMKEKEVTHGQVHRAAKGKYGDETITWEHHNPGIVTDAIQTRKGVNVIVNSIAPMQLADKLSQRYGGKSVIGEIVPDDKMLHDKDGRPYDIAWSPLSLLSRINPAWVIESALGKIAEKTGVPYKVEDFSKHANLTQYALDELKKHGLEDKETVTDPRTGRKIPNVLTGVNFIMKLHHMAEGKAQGRGLGGYDVTGAPARGGSEGSKRLSLGDTAALLSHGATGVLQDAREIRGQKNEQFWLAYMGGYPAPAGKVPFVYEKFLNELKASGINVQRKWPRVQIMALTNKDVNELAGHRELQNAETVRFDRGLEPIKGGLFDPALTGGHGSEGTWAKITLAEPLPNPAFEDPIRHLLGITKQKYEDVLAGKDGINEVKGPQGLYKALSNINVPNEIERARAEIASGRKSLRDQAVRKLSYLKSAQKLNINPKDWFLDAVPVLPTAFRPVAAMQGGKGQLIADPNYLYKELFDANQNLKEIRGKISDTSEERLALYNAFKSVVGLGEPISPKNQERGVKGLLHSLFGSSPKFSLLQRQLLGVSTDIVGRGVIVPNPDLHMDEAGIPESKAWPVFQPFVIRELVRSGVPRLRALQEVEEKSKMARGALLKVMDERPVVMNRYPILHKYGIMAFHPKLVPGDAIQVSPIVTKGLGADFDGDAMQFHVPVSESATKDAYDKMLPSKNLFHQATFKANSYLPQAEYQQGLHAASTAKSDKKHTRVFASAKDAIAAFNRGEIDLGDQVEIVH